MDLFDRFLQERTYLKGVSPKTLDYYRWVRRAFAESLAQPTKEKMLTCIQKLLASGVSPISVNTYLRGFKAYINWLRQEGHLNEVFKVQMLRTEQKVLATFTPAHIHAFINWKAVGSNEVRLKTLILCALDTGMRVGEILSLHREQINLDGLTILVKGKGNRQRLIPMSIEFRKFLFRQLTSHNHAFIFPARMGQKLSQRNLLRDFKVVCKRLGITGVRTSFHIFRHSFAVNWLRQGGNLYSLQRILGHSSITTTEQYCRNLGIDDLVKEHSSRSLLCR